MIKLKKRAARIILDKGIDTPSVEMFNQLSWMTFPERVNFQKAVMMYKIFNNLTPSYLPEYFKMTSDIHQRSLRSTAENLLYIPKPNTELFRKSLSYSGSKIWNAIPDHIKRSTPQPLYNTIVWVQANFRVSYPNRVITKVKYIVIKENKSQMTIWGPTLIRVISKTVL